MYTKQLLPIVFVLVLSAFCSSVYAQVSATQIKNELAGKEWKITKYETFGVVDQPTPAQLHDKIVLNTDMTFLIVENGIEYKGKWSILNPAEYIQCKAPAQSWDKTYKIISIGEKASVLEYKDPVLIKTKYYLSPVE
jgi:hypothetical protein